MIMPTNKVKKTWDWYITILLIYTALVVPYTVCFNTNRDDLLSFSFDILSDCSFFLDILLTFLTAL
jgi:hypothetical protein